VKRSYRRDSSACSVGVLGGVPHLTSRPLQAEAPGTDRFRVEHESESWSASVYTTPSGRTDSLGRAAETSLRAGCGANFQVPHHPLAMFNRQRARRLTQGDQRGPASALALIRPRTPTFCPLQIWVLRYMNVRGPVVNNDFSNGCPMLWNLTKAEDE
jgi:hypothetical protein